MCLVRQLRPAVYISNIMENEEEEEGEEGGWEDHGEAIEVLFLPKEIGNMLGDEDIRMSAGLMYVLLWIRQNKLK